MSDLDDALRLLVQGHLEGTLSSAQRSLLEQRLRDDPGLHQEFRAQVRESLRCAAWYGTADGEKTALRVEALIRRGRASSASITSTRVRDRIDRRQRIRLAAWTVSAAAALLLGWVVVGRFVGQSDAVLDGATPGMRLLRDGAEVAIGPLHPGDEVIGGLGDAATIRYSDGTQVRAVGPCQVRIVGGANGKRLAVAYGQVDAEVARQPVGRPFTVATSTARAEVVGTTFHLAADDRATVLEVGSGTVRFGRSSEPTMIDVPAGHCVGSDDEGPLAARPLPPPFAGPPPARIFDVESGTRPRETHLGVIAAGPPRPASRWCLASERNPDHPAKVMVWLMDFKNGLFAVGADTEVSWDYWAEDDADRLTLWLYDQEQQASYRIVLTGVVHRRWTSVTVKLSELSQDKGNAAVAGPAIGHRITSLHVACESRGVLFIDNLRVTHRGAAARP